MPLRGTLPTVSPESGPGPRVLLDVSHTLDHGQRSLVGLIRVEAEVLAALRGAPGLALALVRHDPAGGYRPLTAGEAAWLEGGRTAAPPGTGGGLRARLRRAGAALPPWARRLGRALRPAMPHGEGAAWMAAGDVLVCAANPWDRVPPWRFQAWRAGGGRLVLVLHDVLVWETPQLTAGRPPRDYVADMLGVLGQADRLVAVSRHSAAALARALAEEDAGAMPPVAIARPALPAALQGAAGLPFQDGRPFVLSCGTIEMRKNHLLLLRVWERLRGALPPGRLPRLVFVGRWGWGAEAVRLWVTRDWRMAPHVTVLEEVPDAMLGALYRHALFTVFPSHAEGYGMPVAESLASGTPVITGTHPALREASEGLMPALDPDDLGAWEREVTRLIEDAGALAALRARAGEFRGPRPGELGDAVLRAVQAENMASPRGFEPPAPRSGSPLQAPLGSAAIR